MFEHFCSPFDIRLARVIMGSSLRCASRTPDLAIDFVLYLPCKVRFELKAEQYCLSARHAARPRYLQSPHFAQPGRATTEEPADGPAVSSTSARPEARADAWI
jgi:hypothetical protein